MSINDDEKLTHVLMGEAVMALLQQGTPVFAEQVAAKLKSMAASESSLSRKRACERALAEVLNGPAEQSSQAEDRLLSVGWSDGNTTLH